jgi:hypothetical protein
VGLNTGSSALVMAAIHFEQEASQKSANELLSPAN